MRVSLVLATYNGEKYICEQLESIYNQTRAIDEVLIFDDGSIDNTVSLVKQFIDVHKVNNSWTLVQNATNKGYARNFVDGCREATGDFIFLSDQDDIWNCQKVELMLNILSERSDINVLCSSIELFYTGNKTQKIDKKYMADMLDNGDIVKISEEIDGYHLGRPGCAMCVRQSFFSQIEKYWIPRWAHDDFFWKMGYIDQSLYKYHRILMKRRMHDSNTTIIGTRTREWRCNLLADYKNQLMSMVKYLGITKNKNCNVESAIKKNIIALEMRIGLVNEGKVYFWPVLLANYRDCYPRFKGIFLDLYLTVFSRTDGKRI